MRALAKRGSRELYIVGPSVENRDTGEFRVISSCFPGGIAETTQPFDVVVGQHFLEHSCASVAAFAAARNLLSPNGEVWIEVPDIAASALSDGGVWLSIVYALHSSYFTRETLVRAGAYAGLQALSIENDDHYGKSLLAVFSRGNEPLPALISANDEGRWDPVVDAMQRCFEGLKQFCANIPSGIACWGAAERCLAVLGIYMAGGFTPGPIIDSNRNLRGLYPSGMRSPVLNPESIQGPLPAALMLSPSNTQAIITSNHQFFRRRPRFTWLA